MEKEIIRLIDDLVRAKKKEEGISICREFLRRIPGIVIHEQPQNGEALSGVFEVFAPVETLLVINRYKLTSEFRLFLDNKGEVVVSGRRPKYGPWCEILEFILRESKLIKAYEDHL